MTGRFRFHHRGLSLSYLDSAPHDRERPALLLLHGFPDHAAMWEGQMAELHGAGYRCIAPDTVGCGESEVAPGLRDYGCVTIAGDHAALLCGGSWTYEKLAGHHWMSLEHPGRINRLILEHLARAAREPGPE